MFVRGCYSYRQIVVSCWRELAINGLDFGSLAVVVLFYERRRRRSVVGLFCSKAETLVCYYTTDTMAMDR